jgi:hypothetical protein
VAPDKQSTPALAQDESHLAYYGWRVVLAARFSVMAGFGLPITTDIDLG